MIGFRKALRFISGVGLAGLLMSAPAIAQGWAIQGQAVDSTGRPLPYATVRVCPYTASGAPCSPLTTIWSDIPQTHTIPNPYTTDNLGNYTFVVNPQQSYLVQIYNGATISNIYLYTAGAVASGANSPCGSTPYGVCFNNSGATEVTSSLNWTILNSGNTLNYQGVSPATGGSPNAFDINLPCNGLGYNLGNNGTSAQGWSGCAGFYSRMGVSLPGISQYQGVYFDDATNGDSQSWGYGYGTVFGGQVDASGEGSGFLAGSLQQRGFTTGTITSGGVTGSSQITAGSLSCTGYCQDAYGVLYYVFNPGGIILDTSHAGITASIVDCAQPAGQSYCPGSSTGLNGAYYDISGATVTPSTAWGNIIPSSCTYRTASLYQVLQPITCSVTLGSGSGSFAAGADIQLSGPFQEESAVTAVGVPSGGVQSITFTSRYAWDNANGNTNGALVMQGGPGGNAFIVTGTSSWPVAYQIVGATSSTRIYFSNCRGGFCNGQAGSNIPHPATLIFNVGTLTRTSNVVTFTGATNNQQFSLPNFPVGSSIVITGAGDASFDGTFTVVSNTYNAYNPVMTWAQTATNSSTSTFVASTAPPQITLYPMAFIIGDNNGAQGVAMLGTNDTAFSNGDTVVSAPSSEVSLAGYRIRSGQATAIDQSGGLGDQVQAVDSGPYPLTQQFHAQNPYAGTLTTAPYMFTVDGSYHQVFYFGDRPSNNGDLFYVAAGDPIPGTTGLPYGLFHDNENRVGITVYPLTDTMGIDGNFSVSGTTTLNTGLNGCLSAASGVVSAVGCGTISGSGTLGYIPKFTSMSAIGNSPIDFGVTNASDVTVAAKTYITNTSGDTGSVGLYLSGSESINATTANTTPVSISDASAVSANNADILISRPNLPNSSVATMLAFSVKGAGYDAVDLDFNYVADGSAGNNFCILFFGNSTCAMEVFDDTPTQFNYGTSLTESTAPSGVSGYDLFYGLTAAHWPAFNPNNAGQEYVVGIGSGATVGHCAEFLSAYVIEDAGSACGSGGGLSGMTTGQIPVAATATTVTSSIPTMGGGTAVVTGTPTGSPNIAIGIPGTSTGTLTLNSSTATGGITLTPASAASAFTVTIPAATDTLVNLGGTQTLTGKSIAGSEINSSVVGATYGGTGANNSSATGVQQWSSGTQSVSTALANGTTATTQSACDNSTKLATTAYTGIVCNLVETSGSPLTANATSTTFWNNTTSAYVIDLPTPSSTGGLQFCFGNYKAQTHAISFVPPSGVTIYYKGVAGTSGSSTGLVSGGAAGDYICVEGTDATTYEAIGAGQGTWTNN